MQQLLTEASRRHDTVIIDSPSLLPVTDAAVLSRLSRITDGTLVVVGSSIVRRPQLGKALEWVDTRILGLLLTRARGHNAGHGQYHSDYSYQRATRERGPVMEQSSDTREPPARAARRSDFWAVVG